VLPGELRRPLGVSRRLVGPGDYRGAKIGIRPGGVAKATFRALGASAKGFPSLPTGLTGFDGAEVGLPTIANNRYDLRAQTLASNVVLWPRATTIFIDAEAFDALSDDQQDVLRRAGRETIAPLLASLESDEQDSLETVCRARRLTLVTASPAQRAALRRAVQPVYDELERDSLTRELIAEIGRMRAGLSAEQPLRCESPPTASRSALDGRWRVELGGGDLRAAGVSRGEVERFRGAWTLEFEAGRWVAHNLTTGNVYRGAYTVKGDVLRETIGSCSPPTICMPGSLTHYRWSVYRDKLSFARIPGRVAAPALVAKPWTRER
jgi:hypothetical protein